MCNAIMVTPAKMLMLIYVSGMLCSILIQGAAGHALPGLDDKSGLSDNVSDLSSPVILFAVGAAILICGLIIVFGCADMCRQEVGFKDFENEDSYQEPVTPQSPPSSFTMYPPVENTPESMMSTSPVVFEPLPDVAMQLKQKQQHMVNAAQLRPKVLQETRERVSSEDSIEEAIHRDTVQEKMKLQHLLTNARNQLPRSQLQYIKELGSGWFGKVLQGEGHQILPGHKKTKVVIQMLKEEAVAQEQLAFLLEGLPYRDVDHPNVLKMLGQCVETPPYLNIVELCPFGDVKTYLRSHKVAMESFNEKGLLLKFACDLAAGLQAMHQQGFIHRDLATRNCLLASDLSVKVGDYGLSEEVFKEDYYFDENGDALPIRWLPPEVIHVGDKDNDGVVLLKHISKEANIWSYGVSLWEILQFGSLPYSDLSNDHVLRLVIKEQSIKLPKPDLPVSHLDRIYQLMQLCWGEPHLRPSLRELRIMLLHLLSRKDVVDTSAFDHKWSQLMPKRPPQITRVSDHAGASEPLSNGSVQVVAASGASPAAASPARVPRPQDFGQIAPSLHDEIAQVHEHSYASMEQMTSPINELSLDAEFSAANMASINERSHDALLANNLSLEQELAAAQTSQTESAMHEDSLQEKLVSADKDITTDESMPEAEHAHLDSTVHTEKDSEITAEGDSEIVIIDHEAETKLGDQNEQKTESTKVVASEQPPPETPADVSEIQSEMAPPSAEVSGVSASELSQSPSEFIMTSTPKKDNMDDTSDMFLSAIQENTATTEASLQSPASHSASESSQRSGSVSSSSAYQTAQSRLLTQQSLDLSLSYEERSIMAEDKFAAILQTVPMMSFDGDDLDPLSSLDRSVEDEVFNASRKTTVSVDGGAGDATLTESIEDQPAAVHGYTQDGQKEGAEETGKDGQKEGEEETSEDRQKEGEEDVEKAENSSEPSHTQGSDSPLLDDGQKEGNKEEEEEERAEPNSESNLGDEQKKDETDTKEKDTKEAEEDSSELLSQTQHSDSPLLEDGQKDGGEKVEEEKAEPNSESNLDGEQKKDETDMTEKDTKETEEDSSELLSQTQHSDSPLLEDGQKNGEKVVEKENEDSSELLSQTQHSDSPLLEDGQKEKVEEKENEVGQHHSETEAKPTVSDAGETEMKDESNHVENMEQITEGDHT